MRWLLLTGTLLHSLHLSTGGSLGVQECGVYYDQKCRTEYNKCYNDADEVRWLSYSCYYVWDF